MKPSIMVEVIKGEQFKIKPLLTEKEIPNTNNYTIYKLKHPVADRFYKILACNYEGCEKLFKKFHNLFDHLRVHAQEKPFVCKEAACGKEFTKKANLIKHEQDMHS